MALSFKFNNSNTKSWFKNNLGKLLVDKLSINVQEVEVYQNTGESMIEVYKDLWRSEEDRSNRQELGIANENVRKLVSKDDSGNKSAKTDGVLDLTIANMFDRMKYHLGKSCAITDFTHHMGCVISSIVSRYQSPRRLWWHKLTDMHLEYEIIESADLAERVRGDFNVGRSLGYDYVTLLKTLTWDKNSTREVIDVNIPCKSMTALMLFFTKSNATDSEKFVFPNLTNVNITVEGNLNDIYSSGPAKRDMYREAVRFF